MHQESANKVQVHHLARTAYLYVRHAVAQQEPVTPESISRQHTLREQAIQLGWPAERIIVIDQDIGRSGGSSDDRRGFQVLMAEVEKGRVGLIMALDFARLTRKTTQWHRLLELCASKSTLLLDQEGLYAPAHVDDRLLLGLPQSCEQGVPSQPGLRGVLVSSN